MENDVFQKSNISWILDFSHWFFITFWLAFSWKSSFFDIQFCIDFCLTFCSENDQKWLQNLTLRLSFLAPFFDPGAQADFWMNFDRQWAPFWHPFAPLWRPLASFWLPLAPLGSFLTPFDDPWLPFGSLFGSFWLHFDAFSLLWLPFATPLAPNFYLFWILIIFLSFWIVFDSVFGCPSNANTISGAPNPAGTHSKMIRESQPWEPHLS